MSKVVRGVKRAVGKVANGIAKVVTKVTGSKTLGKIAKVLAVAATIYFGGAAIMGAVGGATAGAAAGTGWFSGAVTGAGAGISNAWTGLKLAGSAAMSGNFAQAGSSLKTGFTGANAAGATAVNAANMASTGVNLATATPAEVQRFTDGYNTLSGAGNQASNIAQTTANIPPGANIPTGGKPGFFSSDLAKHAAITGGLQIGAGLIQGRGEQQALEAAQAREDALRAEQDRNMQVDFQFGAPGEGSGYTPSGESNQYAGMPYRPFPGGPAQLQARGGMIGSAMRTPQGDQYGYNFPTYNPALGRYGFA
jgi:hypothetical protein